MEKVIKKDPKLVSQITELIENGYNPEIISQIILEQNKQQIELQNNINKNNLNNSYYNYNYSNILQTTSNNSNSNSTSNSNSNNNEVFSDSILLSSQALAYRIATLNDIQRISQIINIAYSCEINGSESFRSGITVTEDEIKELIEDTSYKWLLVEVPDGRGVETDGQAIGVCAFTTDGISRKNGVEEGHVGSIRYLAVLPQYHGALIGHRLLQKVEDYMIQYDCCRVMISIPECRMSMINWILNRDYTDSATIPYPVQATGHTLVKDIPLVIFHKRLIKRNESTENKHLPPIFRMMKEGL